MNWWAAVSNMKKPSPESQLLNGISGTLLSELHSAGQTIVMVTHEEDIAEYAQRTIRMKDGRVMQKEAA